MKNLMLKFKNQRVGFREVEDIAEQLVKKQKNSDKGRQKKYEIIKDLMKHKQNDANDDDKIVRRELKTSKENLGETVRVGTIARYEFMDIVSNELNIVWKEGKIKNEKKVEWAIIRNTVVKEDMEVLKELKLVISN